MNPGYRETGRGNGQHEAGPPTWEYEPRFNDAVEPHAGAQPAADQLVTIRRNS